MAISAGPWELLDRRPCALFGRGRTAALGGLSWALCIGALLVSSAGHARYPVERVLSANSGAKIVPVQANGVPVSPPPVVVTATGHGQAGYVHFFELTAGDGEVETQVGIETVDQRIAWSFPELGAMVSPFIAEGEIATGRGRYRIRHLYAIRPFRDDARMAVLQDALPLRVSALVDDATRYCNDPESRDRFCMSCLGFVLHVVFPGPHPAPPQLPREFMRSRGNLYYTTEDLLLWLTGIDVLPTREARRRDVERMHIPPALREDLLELVAEIDPAERVASTRSGETPRAVATAPQPKARSAVRRAGPRRL
jgi:hypothetical protein